jgi:hypothetical protein
MVSSDSPPRRAGTGTLIFGYREYTLPHMRLETLAGLKDSDHSPRIEQQGIKFNIPLDARTPSCSDHSDADEKVKRRSADQPFRK